LLPLTTTAIVRTAAGACSVQENSLAINTPLRAQVYTIASTPKEIVGFDPYLGYLHTERYGRPSLALDLMEEFRYI